MHFGAAEQPQVALVFEQVQGPYRESFVHNSMWIDIGARRTIGTGQGKDLARTGKWKLTMAAMQDGFGLGVVLHQALQVSEPFGRRRHLQ